MVGARVADKSIKKKKNKSFLTMMGEPVLIGISYLTVLHLVGLLLAFRLEMLSFCVRVCVCGSAN